MGFHDASGLIERNTVTEQERLNLVAPHSKNYLWFWTFSCNAFQRPRKRSEVHRVMFCRDTPIEGIAEQQKVTEKKVRVSDLTRAVEVGFKNLGFLGLKPKKLKKS